MTKTRLSSWGRSWGCPGSTPTASTPGMASRLSRGEDSQYTAATVPTADAESSLSGTQESKTPRSTPNETIENLETPRNFIYSHMGEPATVCNRSLQRSLKLLHGTQSSRLR